MQQNVKKIMTTDNYRKQKSETTKKSKAKFNHITS